MKRILFILFAVLITQLSFSQVEKSVVSPNAGSLGSLFTQSDYDTVTKLIITGHLNAYDFVFIRKFTLLETLDLSGVTIEEHDGEVHNVSNFYYYAPNEFPHAALRNSNVKTVVFPTAINSIGKESFANSKIEGDLVIPNGVVKIDNSAFSSCKNITSVSFPASLEVIGSAAFSGCTNLAGELVLPEALKTIKYNAFSLCINITGTIHFPATLETIGSQAFGECISLSGSIELPSTLVSVGSSVFSLTNFSSAVINLDTIPTRMFEQCKQLNSVTLNNTVLIDDEAFQNCDKITSVAFPASLKEISNYAFAFTNLSGTLNLPVGLAIVGEGAFYNASKISDVKFPASLTEIGDRAFFGCTGLNSVSYFSSQITKIGMQAFSGCSSLLRIKLPEANALIDYAAFENCSGLKSIILPEQITALGQSVFRACVSVDSIFSYNTEPPVLGENAFQDISRTNCKIYVPTESINVYKQAPQWSEFGNSVVSNVIPDTKSPQLLFNFPGNKTNVSTTPSCILKFDEKIITTDQFMIQLIKKSNNEVVYMYGSGNRVSTDSTMIYMEPLKSVSLLPNTIYVLQIAAGSISDLSNNLFPVNTQNYEFTTGENSHNLVLDFNKSDYDFLSLEYLGYNKASQYCMYDLVGQRAFYEHEFFSRDNLIENNIPITIYKSKTECIPELPSSLTQNAYVSLDNTALTLIKANEYSVYPDSHKRAVINLTTFPHAAPVSDVVVRVSANSFEGYNNSLKIKGYFNDGGIREFSLKGTEDAGYFDYEADSYGNKYYFRDIHFPVLQNENIDSVVVERNGFSIVKIMKAIVYYHLTDKPNVDLGPDRNVCSFDVDYLDAGFFPGATYSWSTGAKTQSIQIGGTNDYWVEVKNSLGVDRDTVHITSYPRAIKMFKDSTIFKCANESVTISAASNPTLTYLWNTGETTQSITVTDPGLYTVVVSNGVCTIIDSVGVVNVSNALRFMLSPCCLAGYDDIQGELYKKTLNNRYELQESKIMYGDMAIFNEIPNGKYIFKAHFLKYSNGVINPWLDTYHDGKTIWSEVIPFNVSCTTDSTITFSLVSKPSSFEFNGTGSISGTVAFIAKPQPQRVRSAENDFVDDCETKVLLYDSNSNLIATTCPASDGSFIFTNLPAGDYKVSIERTGYVVEELITANVTDGGEITNANFTLSEENQLVVQGLTTGLVDSVNENETTLNVYPNPISDKAKINLISKYNESATIEIVDVTGKIFKRDVLKLNVGINEFDIANENMKGVYLLKISTNRQNLLKKLIFK